MKIVEIRSWASDVIDRVKLQRPVEDTRVECKASWVDPKNVARQLAGHANAAKGEPVLWLIGVDEKQGSVTGVDRNELANWYPQLVKEFDGVAPCLIADLNLHDSNMTVVILLFETANAPFLIKVPASDRLEIPWREGTRTRSATRAELLRIFAQLQNQGALASITALSNESPRAQNLAIDRPPFWEYKLTIELLDSKLKEVRRKYDEVRKGRIFRKTRILPGKDFFRVIQEKMSDLEACVQVFKEIMEDEIPSSWGPLGTPGDAIEIRRAVDHYIDAANELVEWEREVLSFNPPEGFLKVQSLMSGLTSDLFTQMEKFVESLKAPFADGDPTTNQTVDIRLVIDFPKGRIDELLREMELVENVINRDPDQWTG